LLQTAKDLKEDTETDEPALPGEPASPEEPALLGEPALLEEGGITLDGEAGSITLKFTGALENFVPADYIKIEPAGGSGGKKAVLYSKGEAVTDDDADVRVYTEVVPKGINEKGEYEYEIKLDAVVTSPPSGKVTLAVLPADKPEAQASMGSANLGAETLAAQFSEGGTGGETIELDAMIEIKDAATLAFISGTDELYTLSEKYKQTADIYISGEWTPIGPVASPFTGSFDGGGYKIFPNITSSTDISIFGYAEGATFENVHIGKGTMKTSNGSVSGIVYYAKDHMTFSHCSNAATLEGTDISGGICSRTMVTVSFKDCWNTGNITVKPTSASKYIGGIVGSLNIGTAGDDPPSIENCYNTGSITGVPETNNISSIVVGGIVGFVGATKTYATIKNCYNTGKVTAKSKIIYAGGINGYITGSADKSKIIACYNTGDVEAVGERQGNDAIYIGGISGQNVSADVSITASYSTGSVTNATTGNNTAKVVGIGGISGYTNKDAVVTNACYWTGNGPEKGVGYTTSATEGSDEGAVKFASGVWPSTGSGEGQSDEWGTQNWKSLGSYGGSYPKLAWEKD
jgi:hypothetical protein